MWSLIRWLAPLALIIIGFIVPLAGAARGLPFIPTYAFGALAYLIAVRIPGPTGETIIDATVENQRWFPAVAMPIFFPAAFYGMGWVAKKASDWF
jgi:hypothetical protein